ncbi:hypothetical protein LMA00_21790 [Burkholderia ambifaria]|uniref:hypothetical protein n=1 Tax=Burkholderia ambifaria TaxID=152480 RepID=UPI001E2CBF4C|nr:hypothetical protein [Burkholderia ambifaria]UEP52061.1 hypothetical protein LMA00_21790 [Burkholderia ambifaria]
MTIAEFMKLVAICRVGRSAASDASRYVLAQSGAPVTMSSTDVQTLLASTIVPGGRLSEHGALCITCLWSFSQSANAKRMFVSFGGQTVLGTNQNAAPSASLQTTHIIRNRGVLNRQVTTATGNAGIGISQGGATVLSVDTSRDASIDFYASLADPKDTVTLEGYTVEVLNPC